MSRLFVKLESSLFALHHYVSGQTVRSHMQVSAYLESDGEASVPHTVPLDVGKIEWRVQWLSAFRHAENEILVLCV
jgi:hypothetical protein